MYKEELTACPVCLAPVKETDRRCPDCGADLKADRSAYGYVNSGADLEQKSGYEYKKGVGYSSTDTSGNNYTVGGNSNRVLPPSGFEKNNYGTKLKAKNTSKTATVFVFTVLIIIFFLSSNIYELFDMFSGGSRTPEEFFEGVIQGDSDYSDYDVVVSAESDDYTVDGSYALGLTLNPDISQQQVVDYYKTVNIIEIQKPRWYTEGLSYTRAPDEEGERMHYFFSDDEENMKLFEIVTKNGFSIYIKNILADTEQYSYVYSTPNYTAISNDDYHMTVELDDFVLDSKSVEHYIATYIATDTYYGYTLQDLIEFESGVTGYGLIKHSDYGLEYAVILGAELDGTETLQIFSINIEMGANYDNEGREIYSVDEVVKALQSLIYADENV